MSLANEENHCSIVTRFPGHVFLKGFPYTKESQHFCVMGVNIVFGLLYTVQCGNLDETPMIPLCTGDPYYVLYTALLISLMF
jgi:hypothetical protein